MSLTAKHCYHSATWIGLAASAYTNYESAPNLHLRVGYLVIPVLASCLSEGLIREWSTTSKPLRTLVSVVLAGLLGTSYEHFSSLISASGGTWFSGHVGAAMVDAAILVCVLATASTPEKPGENSPVVENSLQEEKPEKPEENSPKAEKSPEKPSTPEKREGKSPEKPSTTPEKILSDVKLMAENFGIEFSMKTPAQQRTMVRKTLNCSPNRAARLVTLYSEYLKREFNEVQ